MMQFLPGDLAQLQTDEEANRRRQAQAQALQQAGFNPVQGGNQLLSLLTSVMSTIQGGRMMKDSDAKASEILAKRFELENQQAMAKMEAEQKKRDEDHQRDLQKIDYTNKSAAQYREPKEPSLEEKLFNMLPENLRGQAALGKFGLGPKTGPGPSEMDRKIAQLRQLGASDDQIRGMLLGNQGGSSAPSGYRQTATGGLEPIPGGPADKKNSETGIKARMALENSMSNLDRLSTAARDLQAKPVEKITGLQGTFPNFPGGEAANTEAQLETLKSQVGFGVLQAMRDASATGGALGSIAVRELEMLQNNLAALDTKQSPESFKQELDKIAKYAEGVKARSIAAYESEFGQLPKSGPTNPIPPKGGWSIERLD